jgi:hypothetical protein
MTNRTGCAPLLMEIPFYMPRFWQRQNDSIEEPQWEKTLMNTQAKRAKTTDRAKPEIALFRSGTISREYNELSNKMLTPAMNISSFAPFHSFTSSGV